RRCHCQLLYVHLLAPLSRTHASTAQLSTLSLHDALPIYLEHGWTHFSTNPPFSSKFKAKRDFLTAFPVNDFVAHGHRQLRMGSADRKSTRLNSSHVKISYDVFCVNIKRRVSQRELDQLDR